MKIDLHKEELYIILKYLVIDPDNSGIYNKIIDSLSEPEFQDDKYDILINEMASLHARLVKLELTQSLQ